MSTVDAEAIPKVFPLDEHTQTTSVAITKITEQPAINPKALLVLQASLVTISV
jgi:hypothetical protein